MPPSRSPGPPWIGSTRRPDRALFDVSSGPSVAHEQSAPSQAIEESGSALEHRSVEVESLEADVVGVVDHGLVLVFGDRPADLLVEFLPIGLVVRAVLGHDINERLRGDLLGDELQYALANPEATE